MRGTKMLGRHATMEGYKSSQVFAIAGENQHGIASSYDMNQQAEHGSSNSHTDSANSQEPLWAYQKSSSEGAFSDTHYPAAALQGYENSLPPQYPYIDETPTDPPGNYFAYRTTSEAEGFSRPMSGQYNCATGMGESQYSYQGLPDPSAFFTGGGGGGPRDPGDQTATPNIFIHDNSTLAEGLQTPNTRARRVVHEVIV